MELETIYKSEGIEFNKYLNNTPIVDLSISDYLIESLKSDDKDLCHGWDYLKANLTPYLKKILLSESYHALKYNSAKVEHILGSGSVPDDLKEQLGSFVYVWNEIKRDCNEKEMEDNLRTFALHNGFVEIDMLNSDHAKSFDGKKGECIMDLSKIGLLGSFDEKQILKGRLKWSDHYKTLLLMPPRSKTKGYMVRKNKIYFKEACL